MPGDERKAEAGMAARAVLKEKREML